MNWLAHLHLGGEHPLERLGHLAGDFVLGVDLDALAAPVRRGVLAHRAIDAFTDRHEIVRHSRSRLGPPWTRFSGVLVDVFYDHLLARCWPEQAKGQPPLRTFIDQVHADLLRYRPLLPPRLHGIAPRLVAEDWLFAYRTVPGVRATLGRMAGRLRRPVPLAAAADELAVHHADLLGDFEVFYPQLRAFAERLRERSEGGIP